MIVRMARSGDREALTRLREGLWPDGARDEHRDDVSRILAGRPRSTLPLVVLVAEEGDELIGFVEVGIRSHADGCDPDRPCAYLEGGVFRRVDEHHRLRLHDPERIRSALTRADLDVKTLDGYGPLVLGPGWHAFLATK